MQWKLPLEGYRIDHTMFGIVEGDEERLINHLWTEWHGSSWIDDIC
jgi:hypothetical protein